MTNNGLAKRLLLVVPSARRTGGGDVWLEQLLTHIVGYEFEITVTFESTGELAERARQNGCKVEILSSHHGPGHDDPSSYIAPLADVIRRVQPTVTVFWSPRAQLYGCHAHARAGAPGRTAWVQHVMPSEFWLHRDAAATPTDAVLCVSNAVAVRHEQLYPACRTVVVHPGVDFPDVAVSRTEARASIGCPDSARVLGVVGRVEPWKGQDTAVRMLAALDDPDTMLVLIGERNSPTWPQFGLDVARLAQDLEVANRVVFAGHRHDVTIVLPALDVLVCASREEGFGLAVVEAMAARVPVVATRCGGPEDTVEDGVSGLLVEAEDAVGLAAAVQRITDEWHLTERLVSAARQTWQDRFTGRRSATSFLSAVRGLLDFPINGSRSQNAVQDQEA
jgi:glycosyltransferase involved in cell wall biosynthesis